jgi:hypothetical protein
MRSTKSGRATAESERVFELVVPFRERMSQDQRRGASPQSPMTIVVECPANFVERSAGLGQSLESKFARPLQLRLSNSSQVLRTLLTRTLLWLAAPQRRFRQQSNGWKSQQTEHQGLRIRFALPHSDWAQNTVGHHLDWPRRLQPLS